MARTDMNGWTRRNGRWTQVVHRVSSGRISAAASPEGLGEHAGLARDLAEAVAGEVEFDPGARAMYSTDASNYRQVPLGVVLPRTAEDVVAAVEVCRSHGVPVLPRGGGTGLAGQGCNAAVVLDFSRHLNRVLELDVGARRAVVEPGCILDTLRDAAEAHHLTFGPDPATHDHNTLGGMIGNNSCGVHSVQAGRTSDNVERMEVLTYDGLRMDVGPTSEEELERILAAGGRRAAIYRALDELRQRYGALIRERYPKIPRLVSGYENLDDLLPEHGFNVARALVGTEGTCATVLKATVELIPSPQARVLVILGFDDIFAAADAVPDVLETDPIGLEGMDEMLVEYMHKKHLHESEVGILPEGHGWLIVEFGGEDSDDAVAKAQRLVGARGGQGPRVKLIREKAQQTKVWAVRESGLGATADIPGEPDNWPGWEDSAVARDKLGAYLRELKALFHRYGYDASVYGHFGDGLVHCRVNFDLRHEEGLKNWQSFLDAAADLVVRYGGSLSGEHGDGQARAALVEKMYGPKLMRAFRDFKAIWDPDNRMNPGKVVDPFPITSNLRLGPTYQPPKVDTVFAYPADGGSFAHAAKRCVGVGKCRRLDSTPDGVMCPSYMVTRAEKHSTRGRARLLFEMLHGGPIADGWKSDEVEDALDLCLACKGCKSDCPVNVDMATYKGEFRAHYYVGRLRPRSAYSMGLIHRWSRIAGTAPWLANAVLRAPGLSNAAKWAGGIAQERELPTYARETFRHWFARRRGDGGAGSGRRVILWPDTFNNFFRPETAIAATRLLEAAGFQVAIPDRVLCCGRPLYDWGMIDRAKHLWQETFASLRQEIEAGTLLVGLEPACVSAFRDELLNLYPEDALARQLAERTSFITEFLTREAKGSIPTVGGKALVHVHCHHHAVIGADDEREVLTSAGVDYEVLPSGCCGMAGAFGFEHDKYEISMAAAERVLLPAVRDASPRTAVLTDGFSCREQIEQGTGRRTVHVAELLAGALDGGGASR